MALKYFEYISDAKVDMLLPQIPLAIKQRISFEGGFDLKVFSGKLKSEYHTLEDRVARATAVANYIVQTEPVGSLDCPARWIAGVQEVQSGFMGSNNEIVVYGGSVFGLSFILAGSASHVTGYSNACKEAYQGYSFLPSLLRAFKDADRTLEESITDLHPGVDEALATEMGGGVDDPGSAWMAIAKRAWKNFDGPPTKIEFLAKTLFLDGGDEDRILIASPIYVARMD